MTDSAGPPQLGQIPQSSGFNVPTMSNINSVQDAKDTVYNSEYCRVTPASNIDISNQMLNTFGNGPVADKVKDQHAKTSSEFRNLADSRTVPKQSTATGQNLTHYHSFFYNLLSWENPRATTLSFISIVLFIFAARYLPALRWSFKALYMVLGVTAAAEIAGKIVLSQGLASSFRPKKYYTIPREALEASLEDVEQLINFFVIEFQRMLFAENVTHTVAGFVAAVASYWLIKFVPFWGLSLIGASCIYLGPLIYMTNKELIDHHLKNASDIANAQANQVRSLAGHHTARAQETVRAYAGDYSAKAQEYIGSARGRSTSPEVNSSTPAKSEPGPGPNDTARAQETVKAYAGDYSAKAQEYVDSARGYSTSPEVNRSTPVKFEPGSGPNYSPNDFPHAPKQEPTPGVTSHQEQYENSQFGGQAEPTT